MIIEQVERFDSERSRYRASRKKPATLPSSERASAIKEKGPIASERSGLIGNH